MSVVDVMSLFRDKVKLYRIAEASQEHRRLRLILNLSAQPNEGTPSVKNTMDREFAPESMQFGRAFPHFLQDI